MFIPLEGGNLVSLSQTIALVRQGKETTIYLRDGSVLKSGFKPETLARRYNSFMKEARANTLEANRPRNGGSI